MLKQNKRRASKFTNIVFVFFLLPATSIFSQDNMTAISAAFNQYHQNTIQEKIFVHCDKSFYVAGEILWFKLYDVDATFHKPLDLSKIAYVEICDTANRPVSQAKISLQNGTGKGSFYLPVTLSSGNYKLRAYTNWMKNFDPGYFFEKPFTIINVQKIYTPSNTDSSYRYDVQFFPEGGNLVNNIESEIAFKAVDMYGAGINFTGYIIDNADTLQTFYPAHTGMGHFMFKPLSGHTYKVLINPAKGLPLLKDLPVVYQSGYVMHLTATDDNRVRITVQSNITFPNEVYLIAHTREVIKVASRATLQNGIAEFTFDKSLLGNGVSHITIFDSQKQPVCERLYFKRPAAKPYIGLNADQTAYETRKKINLDITLDTAVIKNDTASLSMSVYRVDSLQGLDNNTIETYLLLSSELKGGVEDPQYYFTGPQKEAGSAADDLMLTNGWRRFKWEDVLQNKKPVFSFVPEYIGHVITGTVTNKQTSVPALDIETFLSVPGTRTQFTTSTSDSDGQVKFEMRNFYGSSKIVVQTNTRRDTIYDIDIDNSFSNSFSNTGLPVFTLPVQYPNTLLEHSIGMQVQNIYVADKSNQFNIPVEDSTPFYLHPDESYLLDNYTRFTTVEEVLREYVVYVDVARREGKFHFPVLDLSTGQKFEHDPLVLVDGIPYFELNRFMALDPLKLRKLDVVNRKYFFGNSIFEGILNWQTYTGDLFNAEIDPHAIILNYEGLQYEREFYSPVYDSEEKASVHLPDFRNVLYWSPDIEMTAGKKQINFYSSDLPGKYAAVVQGITNNGLCGSDFLFFEVKK